MATLKRTAHVYRIFQTDDKGNVTDPDTWLDVLRIDSFFASEPRGSQDGDSHKLRQYAFLWGDDTILSWHIPPRQISKLTVSQPPADGSGGAPDPNASGVDMPLIERTNLNFRGPTGKQHDQGETHDVVEWVFKNMPDKVQQTGRKETTLRITNNDLNNEITMPTPNVGDPQPPTDPTVQEGGGVQWTDYVQALVDGTVDDSQFVDVYVTDFFNIRFPPPYFSGHLIAYALKQKKVQESDPLGVEDVFKQPPSNAAGIPVRTDPLQIIVNVSWGGLAVEFGDKAGAPPPRGP